MEHCCSPWRIGLCQWNPLISIIQSWIMGKEKEDHKLEVIGKKAERNQVTLKSEGRQKAKWDEEAFYGQRGCWWLGNQSNMGCKRLRRRKKGRWVVSLSYKLDTHNFFKKEMQFRRWVSFLITFGCLIYKSLNKSLPRSWDRWVKEPYRLHTRVHGSIKTSEFSLN